ncbi:MAG TPA: type II toxin-antitoxin system Phd/YefM family antitoxin [Thermoanaerobaculia bacterium]|nr:type II toxin-antitoxin system Phd/YefM family antitoxin [Thermoanaerobaculia bacterium]
MRAVSLHYAQTHLSHLVDQARAGEEIVIQEGETPLVRLTPVPVQRERVFGIDEGKVVIPDDFDDPMPELEDMFYNSPDDPA